MPSDEGSDRVTVLLDRIRGGDEAAVSDLLPLVYDQLRALAGSYFRNQRPDHTLQPTALVHEAYVKLVRSDSAFMNRAHFCAVAATAMRQVLVNHARDKAAAKRKPAHGAEVDLTLSFEPASGVSVVDILALDEALERLTELDENLATLVELRCFGGLSGEEIAAIQGVSGSAISQRWRAARAWLTKALG